MNKVALVLLMASLFGCAKYHPCITVDGSLSCYKHTYPKKEALDVAKAVGSVSEADGYTAIKDDARYKADKGSPAPASPVVSRPAPDSKL